jgi:hypothetical protein
MRCPSCCSCGVMESSIVPFHKSHLVFKDTINAINILYSRHLAMYEHFVSVCVE